MLPGASLLGNILAGKEAIVKRQGREIHRVKEGVIKSGDSTATKRQAQKIGKKGHGNKRDF